MSQQQPNKADNSKLPNKLNFFLSKSQKSFILIGIKKLHVLIFYRAAVRLLYIPKTCSNA